MSCEVTTVAAAAAVEAGAVPLPALPTPCPVAVCVPVHGDPDGLMALLASLEQVDHPRTHLTVIVAVDGPDDDLAAVARRAGAEAVVLPENRGSYAARNAAIDVLPPSAAVVLFTDADVTVGSHWVAAHLEALAGASMSGGGIRVTTSSPPTPAEWVDGTRHLNQRMLVENLGYGATANLAVRRHVLDRVRFDDGLRSGGDRDFGNRARGEGFRLVLTESAWVSHPARPTAAALLRKVDRVARGIADLRRSGSWSAPVVPYRREAAVARARREGLDVGWGWALQAQALDRACDAIWVLRAPEAIGPAVRRRLPRARPGPIARRLRGRQPFRFRRATERT